MKTFLLFSSNRPDVKVRRCALLAAMLFLGAGSLMAGSPGQLLREIWENIEGDQLPGHKDWPAFYGEPTHTVMLNGVETPVNRGNNYGQRLRGWITPTVTGEHTFWIAGDNFSQLWLSTTASKFDKERIAFIDGWTNVRQWDKFASQQSTPVHLVAGQKYYLEILQKEGTGGDHVSIAWQPPGGSQVVVPASVLESFDGDPLDVDDDDLPDAWEIEMGLSVEPGAGKSGGNGSEGDPDGDGFSNMEEWFADSDPLEYERIPGGLTREVWRDLTGATVGHLTNSPRFLQRPTFRGFMSGADAPVDDGENYGQRLRGYVTIPESGNYRFHIAGDDHVELWIAESGSHFDRRKAAWHTTWTNHLEWGKAGTQQTAALPLTAGQKLYVEALQKEALGGDNLSIGWSFNGGLPGLIPEEHLEAFATHPDDVDEDYLSDSWELEHGFDVGDNGLLYPDQRWSADPDGDGFNNLLEYQSGGDPHVQGGNLGYFRRDIWTGLDGDEVADLTSSPGFPQSPNSSTYVSGKLELGTYGDRYGQKLTGVLMPPLSGQWRFSITSDNSSELWLSSTTSPAIKQKIAWLTGYTGFGNFDAFPSQKSEWIHLNSNNDYYIEVLHKEGIGADHVSVAWEYQAFNWALAANGSTATQSSTYGGLEADRAIDGNTDGNPAVPTATHTQNLANSWWQVDFGQDRPVNRVVLFNRTDSNAIQNQERLSNFRISVLDAADNELVGQDFFTTSGYVQKSMAWDLPELVNARKIKVQILGHNLKGNGFLCLAEVQAFDWIGENARQVITPQHLRTLGSQDVDSDGNGLPDRWELERFGSLAQGASGDYDNDGVSNMGEFVAGTNPTDPQEGFLDTDEDGLPDWWEQMIIDYSDDPLLMISDINPNDDFDGDGLSNLREYQLGLIPYLKDSDGDGYSDRLSADQALHLKLDGESGTTVVDSSGHGRDGLIVSAPVWRPEGGVDTGALEFGGGGDAVLLPASVLDGVENLTMSLWFKTTESSTQTLLSAAGAASAPELAISIESGQSIRFNCGGAASVVWDSGRSLADGLWHHLVIVRNAGENHVSLDLDGAPFGSPQNATLAALQVGSLVLGQRHQTVSTYDSGHAYQGHIDELRIHSTVLEHEHAVELFQPNDLDRDGLPDDWEISVSGDLSTLASGDDDPDGDGVNNRDEHAAGTDPGDYYNGETPVITLFSGAGQTVYNAERTAEPLVFLVTDGTNPLENAPVELSHLELIGGLQTPDGGTTSPSLTLRTDSEGKVSVYFKAD